MPVARIDIRMIPTSQLPKGALDLIHRGRSADLENQIQIFATCHDSAVSPSAATVRQNYFSFFFSSASTYSASMTSSVFPPAAVPEPSLAGPRWPPACEPDLYIASAS